MALFWQLAPLPLWSAFTLMTPDPLGSLDRPQMVRLAASPSHMACFPIKSLYLTGPTSWRPSPSGHLLENIPRNYFTQKFAPPPNPVGLTLVLCLLRFVFSRAHPFSSLMDKYIWKMVFRGVRVCFCQGDRHPAAQSKPSESSLIHRERASDSPHDALLERSDCKIPELMLLLKLGEALQKIIHTLVYKHYFYRSAILLVYTYVLLQARVSTPPTEYISQLVWTFLAHS